MGIGGLVATLGSVAGGMVAARGSGQHAINAVEAASAVVDHVFQNDEEQLDRRNMMLRLLTDADQLQAKINTAGVSHPSLLVAGWRPFIGWVCGLALVWHYLVQPLLAFTLLTMGVEIAPISSFDLTTLDTILFGMLGLGTLRTAEKAVGRA